MPVKILAGLPVKKMLAAEGIFTMDKERASKQDIRPLKFAIVNLMPKKIETELQLLRLISQSPLQIEVDFVQMASHQAKNISASYLETFYLTFPEMKENYYDGLIITGAPVEKLPFEAVDYWQELEEIMAWSQSHVTSNLHICWGAQAGLYHHYQVEKTNYQEKVFGIFENQIQEDDRLIRGFSDCFFSPQSRYTGVNATQIAEQPLKIVANHPELGPLILVSEDRNNVFVLGHLEYDTDTLEQEYLRDKAKGLATRAPVNYYQTGNEIKNSWRSEACLFYHNWVNEVYQRTPYEWV
ncbi:homoserine O-succinyltransferase [Enterococcus sp. AZ103]|uniref:homoserine O-succinyltransferase n=1 Tax=Enterococcus sp. AZ103 TaxID=2774628 RepID=UPI003F227F0E